MMTPDDIRAALHDKRIDIVSSATGLHYNTVRDIRDNDNANPTWRVIKALSDYLSQGQKEAAQ